VLPLERRAQCFRILDAQVGWNEPTLPERAHRELGVVLGILDDQNLDGSSHGLLSGGLWFIISQ